MPTFWPLNRRKEHSAPAKVFSLEPIGTSLMIKTTKMQHELTEELERRPEVKA
jgi:hypothetical protein